MCLAVPGRVVSVMTADGMRVGRVDFGGIAKDVALDLLPEADVGDFVLVHVGLAISKVDAETARETLAWVRQMGPIEEELGAETHPLAKGPP